MEIQLVYQRKAAIFLTAGLFLMTNTETKEIPKCEMRCPQMNISRECIGKDYIILDDVLCESCDLDICILSKWPPDVAIPFCPTIKCDNIDIPANCVIRQFRKINRRTLCRACDIDVCKNPPTPATTLPPALQTIVYPLCPKLRCKLSDIPKECLLPTYEVINGQKCRQCDEDACRHPPALRTPTKRNVKY